MSRKLVAFFSAGRETRFTARELAQIMEADLYEIKPLAPYTEQDLDYMNPESRSCLENKEPGFRPKLAEETTDLSSYDLIFLGFPVWFDTCPRIIASFIEHNDFKRKTIVPFATSKGGSMGSAAKDIQAYAGEDTKVTEGMLLNGTISRFKIQTWLLTIGISE